MTGTFVKDSDDQSTGTVQNSFQNGDQATGGTSQDIDTQSPEYQNQVMQKRINDSQEYIQTLESENQKAREMYAELEERMQNMSKIEEVLKNRGQEQDVSNQDTGLDEDALVGKVIENLNQKQTKQKMEENYNSVLSRLNNEFGEQHVETKVSEAAQANGLSIDDMVETARKSPTAFYRLIGVEAKGAGQQTPQPTRGSQQPPQTSNERDFAYYANLMRTNPREYWKPEVQREFRKLFQKDK